MPKKSDKASLVTQFQPDSQFAEAYRAIRTTIKYSALDKGKRIILITSSLPAEGKTSIAVNLAILSAQDGKRVLIIDADLRRPHLHFILNCPNRNGLSTVLSGLTDLSNVIVKTNIDRLALLPAGPIQSRPAELLSSKAMDDIVNELIQEYDVIFIDSPPLLTVTDATLIARISEGIIIVARSGITKKEHIKRAQKILEPFNERIIGIIFNGANQYLEGLR